MLKVGITGQSGFIGTHLYNTLGLQLDKYERIDFNDSIFNNSKELADFVSGCDVIVHLAAMNRHNDPDVIYSTNIDLVKKLINACETTQSKPYMLFSSSTQENNDNLYGRSKNEGRKLFEYWAKSSSAKFTGLIIPNVFGPFGHPYYNSVVATFCHQLTHNETPKIDVDGELKLIYVGELVSEILKKIDEKNDSLDKLDIKCCPVSHTSKIKVSELLKKLCSFKENYFNNGMIPDLSDTFEMNLFNTFMTYIDHKLFFPFHLKLNTDDRGTFVETVKLNSGGQVSFSTTKPNITRGNHFHIRKAERFAVIKGKAKIEFRRIGTEDKFVFELNGENPSFVDMPIWFTHNITNIGSEDVYTIFWISEHFTAADPDTFFEQV